MAVVEFPSKLSRVATARSTCPPVVPKSAGSTGGVCAPGERIEPAKSKVAIGTREATWDASVIRVDDTMTASRSNPLNWPGDPAAGELLS